MGYKKFRLYALGFYLFAALGSARALDVGDKAPGVILSGVDASGKFLVSSVANVVDSSTQSYTLIEFFQTENAESKQNLGVLSELFVDVNQYVGIRMVATNTENADVLGYIKNNQADVKFPVQFDSQGDAQRAYGVTKVPTIFVVQNEKDIVYKFTGAVTADAKAQILKAVGFDGGTVVVPPPPPPPPDCQSQPAKAADLYITIAADYQATHLWIKGGASWSDMGVAGASRHLATPALDPCATTLSYDLTLTWVDSAGKNQQSKVVNVPVKSGGRYDVQLP